MKKVLIAVAFAALAALGAIYAPMSAQKAAACETEPC